MSAEGVPSRSLFGGINLFQVAPTFELSCLDALLYSQSSSLHLKMGRILIRSPGCGRKQEDWKHRRSGQCRGLVVILTSCLKHLCIRPSTLHTFTQMSTKGPFSSPPPTVVVPHRTSSSEPVEPLHPAAGARISPANPSISSSCRYHEETANKERDLITGNKTKDTDSLIFFCIASNLPINSRHLTQ